MTPVVETQVGKKAAQAAYAELATARLIQYKLQWKKAGSINGAARTLHTCPKGDACMHAHTLLQQTHIVNASTTHKLAALMVCRYYNSNHRCQIPSMQAIPHM